MMMIEHEVHHRSQIDAYAGLNGWPVTGRGWSRRTPAAAACSASSKFFIGAAMACLAASVPVGGTLTKCSRSRMKGRASGEELRPAEGYVQQDIGVEAQRSANDSRSSPVARGAERRNSSTSPDTVVRRACASFFARRVTAGSMLNVMRRFIVPIPMAYA
jgi:hypothetical protein